MGYMSGLFLLLSIALPFSAQATPLDLATVPLANSPTITIRANLLFIFDDSGSMADDSMPDVSNSTTPYLFRNASYNTIYYNPAVRYLPPAYFTASGINTTTYPSQTGDATASGASSAAKPNWKVVKKDAYGKVATGTTDLTADAFYFTTIPGEFCKNADLKVCNAQTAANATYPFPAPVRWCTTTGNATAAVPAANTCQASNFGSFTNFRIPGPRVATVAFTNGGGTNRKVSGITISGSQIMSGTTATNTNSSTTMAQETVTMINNCTFSQVGSCTVAGYSATSSGGTVTIYAPAGSTTTVTPAATTSPTGYVSSTSAFAKINPNVPGQTVFTAINNSAATYGYPGTASKVVATRSDCAGSTCTYTEEMTNYANWYTYYRTRAQMMKTATSLAFKDIGDDFKVGFMTTSGASGRASNFASFTTANKAQWYTKLFSTVSDTYTPLRGALSTAGLIYASKTNLNGVFTDPIEYECQQNFTLLTTDGFWNTQIETPRTQTAPANVPATYGPFNLTGGNVGNMDSLAKETPLGMREGTPAVSDTLADVAKYYRDTDLRTAALGNCNGALGSNVCETPVTSGSPLNEKQTMVTMTMGLGADGTLAYIPHYDTVPGDYLDIKAGTKSWSNPIANGGAERIDDLWHAAVNGAGTYFSAKSPTDVVNQLKEAIASIKVKVGTGAAAATSTLNPVTGDNYAYVASYTSGYWIGNLERRTVNTTSGEVSKSATHCVEDVVPTAGCASPASIVADGSGGYNCVTPNVTTASACVGTLEGTDCKVPVSVSCTGTLKTKVSAFTDTRTILINAGGSLQSFSSASLTSAQKVYLDKPWLAANLTQWPSLTTNQQNNATVDNLVSYLRGQTGYDMASSVADNRVFRKRQATLGDLINSKPAFIGKPVFNYTDPGYDAYKTAQVGRAKTVYVGSNDGMLHAFDADTMVERWAYIPSMVIPNLWKLADSNYSAKHSYYADGDIVISDICYSGCNSTGATWKTILVAGLNGGGRGYYALDITNPTSPSLLWEFDAKNSGSKADQNLGYTYGNPVVTKRNIDDRWVVLFTSGYNNVPDNDSFYSLTTTKFKPNNPAMYTNGDGRGYLYVVDAVTGDKLAAISTTESTTPSGLAKIKAYAEDAEKNNATTHVYGGDLLGNLWRFNIDDNTVLKFAKLQANGIAQPITTSPELGLVDNKKVIIAGTGKYLEVADLTNSDQQTLYAIKDDSATATLNNPRATLVQQTIVPDGADTRKSGTNNGVNFTTGNGWYVDFPDPRERQNISSRLVLGTLLLPTTVPTSTACQPAGYGWFNYLDYRTGLAVKTTPSSNVVSQRTTAPSVGFNVVYIDGKPKVSNVVADNPNPVLLPDIPFAGSGTGFQVKRSIWREITE
ncbi:MAG TPA: hypothetical protein DCG63_03155 [Methylophilaceae bacterium]|nr:hypothetical protein [Methylophilaceae bacterium]